MHKKKHFLYGRMSINKCRMNDRVEKSPFCWLDYIYSNKYQWMPKLGSES